MKRGQKIDFKKWKPLMTNADFVAWHTRMGFTYDAGRLKLGVSQATYSDCLSGICRTTGKPVKYKPMLAWACAAIEAGIKPLGVARQSAPW